VSDEMDGDGGGDGGGSNDDNWSCDGDGREVRSSGRIVGPYQGNDVAI
jgi:hypothetical protein